MPVSWPHFQLTPPYNPNCAGCIFHYDDEFTENSGKGFKEADKPNFTGSYYSFTKAMVESLLKVGGHTHRLQGARSAWRELRFRESCLTSLAGLLTNPPPVWSCCLQEYPNVLTLRVRMPIVQDLTYPRNFISKIIKYDKVSARVLGAGDKLREHVCVCCQTFANLLVITIRVGL
jgi:hypothetical protein